MKPGVLVFSALLQTLFPVNLSFNSIPQNLPLKSPHNIQVNPVPAAACKEVDWAVWSSITTKGANATITHQGKAVNVTMNSSFNLESTPQIGRYAEFRRSKIAIPNATVARTSWSDSPGGSLTVCFSENVKDPVLLLASLGSFKDKMQTTISFSQPYIVLYNEGGMVINNSTMITGREGYGIIKFSGEIKCITINSSTKEDFTDLTWGISVCPDETAPQLMASEPPLVAKPVVEAPKPAPIAVEKPKPAIPKPEVAVVAPPKPVPAIAKPIEEAPKVADKPKPVVPKPEPVAVVPPVPTPPAKPVEEAPKVADKPKPVVPKPEPVAVVPPVPAPPAKPVEEAPKVADKSKPVVPKPEPVAVVPPVPAPPAKPVEEAPKVADKPKPVVPKPEPVAVVPPVPAPPAKPVEELPKVADKPKPVVPKPEPVAVVPSKPVLEIAKPVEEIPKLAEKPKPVVSKPEPAIFPAKPVPAIAEQIKEAPKVAEKAKPVVSQPQTIVSKAPVVAAVPSVAKIAQAAKPVIPDAQLTEKSNVNFPSQAPENVASSVVKPKPTPEKIVSQVPVVVPPPLKPIAAKPPSLPQPLAKAKPLPPPVQPNPKAITKQWKIKVWDYDGMDYDSVSLKFNGRQLGPQTIQLAIEKRYGNTESTYPVDVIEGENLLEIYAISEGLKPNTTIAIQVMSDNGSKKFYFTLKARETTIVRL